MVALNENFAPEKPALGSKNRVGNFFGGVAVRAGEYRPATRNRIGEKRPTLTIIASGRPVWPSRDPIGENGGLNLYAMVGNDTLNRWDYLGLTENGSRNCTHEIRVGHLLSDRLLDDFLNTDFEKLPCGNRVGYSTCGGNELNNDIPEDHRVDLPRDPTQVDDPFSDEHRDEVRRRGGDPDGMNYVSGWGSRIDSQARSAMAAAPDDCQGGDSGGCCRQISLNIACSDAAVRGERRERVAVGFPGGDPGDVNLCGKTNTYNCETGRWSGWE